MGHPVLYRTIIGTSCTLPHNKSDTLYFTAQ